ncbi:MAG TPA: hypothetical protein VNB24_09125 [Acidimicrobiales bacterium]|nr:hypothetical protein [Acidimicrobiales bacterium]
MATTAGRPPTAGLSASALGPDRRQALRALLTALSDQGWRDDDGAAVAILAVLDQSNRPVAARRAAKAVPAGFLARNRTTRARIAEVLAALAESPR